MSAMATKVGDETFVYCVGAVSIGRGMNYRALGDNSDVGRARTDIDNGGRSFIVCQDTRSESGRETLFHHVNFADASLFRGVDHSSLFDVRDV